MYGCVCVQGEREGEQCSHQNYRYAPTVWTNYITMTSLLSHWNLMAESNDHVM